MFLAKFDSSGNLVWVRQETASGGEGGVAVDQSGNVYVTGAFNNDVNLGGVTLTNAGSFDAYLVKYSSSGVFQWARRAGGTNFDFYWDAAVDLQGNVYAAGVLGSAAVGPSGLGAIIAKYDGSGTLQWVTSAGSPAANPLSSIAAKCAVDSSGNSYIAGWYQTATTFGTNALQPQSPAACWNYFLAKSGWTRPTLGIEGSNSVIRLSVFGDINNRFVLEYISRFVASNYWNSLSTTTFVRSPMILTDTNTGSSSRFYRARLVP